MATRLHIGSSELRGEIAAYAKRFDLLEVRGMDAPNLRLAPNPATLRRWRKAVPDHFDFAVVSGPNLAKLKEGEAYDVELKAMLETAKTLEARLLVIATPSDVTPSKLQRDRFAALLDKLPREEGGMKIVWEPSGLWELEDAAVQAQKWGVVLSVDPARDIIPVGKAAFGRLRALGGTRAYSTAALEKVAAAIGSERDDAYVVFETQNALKEGKTLRRLVRAVGSKTSGGLGTLLRPRGAVVDLGDDFDDDEEDLDEDDEDLDDDDELEEGDDDGAEDEGDDDDDADDDDDDDGGKR